MGLIAAMPADSRCHTGIVIGGLGGIRSREPVAVFTGYNVSRRYPLVLSGTQAVGLRGGFEPPTDRNASYRSDQLSYRSHWRADWHRRFGRRRRSTLSPCNVGRYAKTQPRELGFSTLLPFQLSWTNGCLSSPIHEVIGHQTVTQFEGGLYSLPPAFVISAIVNSAIMSYLHRPATELRPPAHSSRM